ncbi:MAG: nucleoside triphosphate pyrophosphohydrolase [Syntrophomonadaceae bacterium]|nr:nucleoside triphosphate pyrophosphohydrolase [Syntrophomonadaceae bacterium]
MIMNRLLGPDGCPWDKEQTHQSLARYLIEECYEVVEAIKSGEMSQLREELGDLLLQVVFHAALAERAGHFDLAQVADTVAQKMINRHPHVFSDLSLQTSSQVLEIWEGFKKDEGKKTILEGIPAMLPALLRAFKIQEKAARVGFDWPDAQGAVEKLKEEIDELGQAQDADKLAEEMGDVFFALVNVARLKGIEPEGALQATNDKFIRRFNYIEEKARAAGRDLQDMSLAEMDSLWDEAKKQGM